MMGNNLDCGSGRKKLSNLDIPVCNHVVGHSNSEDLANVLPFKRAQCHVVVGQELRFYHTGHSHRHPLLHFGYEVQKEQ